MYPPAFPLASLMSPVRKDFRNRIYPMPNKQTEPLKALKFLCVLPQVRGLHETTFKTGLGPCGRYVTELSYEIHSDLLVVSQTSYPEDYGHISKTGVTMMQNYFRDATRIRQHGFGNVQWMTPSEEQHAAARKRSEDMQEKVSELLKQSEIKEFVYKLTDVHGRIEATK